MKLRNLWVALVVGLAALAARPAFAGTDDEQARKDMVRAQQEVEKARVELQRATRELARSMAKVERDNPRVQYFAYMTDPDRAVLGVLIPDDTEAGEDRGVRLLAVTPGSGADKAGLRAGDLVLSLNGTALARDGKQLPQKRMREVLKTLKAGDPVKVEFERDGKKKDTTVVTRSPEPDLAFAMAPPATLMDEMFHDEDFDMGGSMSGLPMLHFRGPAIRGLELCKVDEELGTYFKTSQGVLVVKAPKNGALSLKGGDVILKINGDPVTEPVTVLDKLRSRNDEQTVKLELMRQGKKIEIDGKIPVADLGGPRTWKFQEKRRRVRDDDDKDDDSGG